MAANCAGVGECLGPGVNRGLCHVTRPARTRETEQSALSTDTVCPLDSSRGRQLSPALQREDEFSLRPHAARYCCLRDYARDARFDDGPGPRVRRRALVHALEPPTVDTDPS